METIEKQLLDGEVLILEKQNDSSVTIGRTFPDDKEIAIYTLPEIKIEESIRNAGVDLGILRKNPKGNWIWCLPSNEAISTVIPHTKPLAIGRGDFLSNSSSSGPSCILTRAISRQHFSLQTTPDGNLTIKDFSTNGTYLKAVRST